MPALQSWYDQPRYYDLAFADETPLECAFFEAAFRRYAQRPVKSVLEPACGSGRLVAELAARGFALTAFDANQAALRYLRRRLQRRRLSADVFTADMTCFDLRTKVDAAVSTVNTFRHLLSEQAAWEHLRSVARSVKKGGIYILGFHLLPLDIDEECTERWSVERGRTRVTTTLRVLATDRRRRLERVRISLRVRDGNKDLRFRDEFSLRMYTATQFRRLLAKLPEWEFCDVFDFWYDIEDPLELDDEITDSVFILRRTDAPL